MRPPTALVADDCALTGQVHADVLQNLGYVVDVVGSGNAAVEQTRYTIRSHGRPHDVTLLDFDMPDGDGPSSARMIRAAQFGLWAPPLLCVTSHALQQVEKLCLQAGFDAVVAKPLRVETLIRWLGAMRPASPEAGVREVTAGHGSHPIDAGRRRESA